MITFGGNEIKLLGEGVNVGDKAPNFKAVKTDMSEFELSSLKGKVVVISAVPSVDTGICELQTKRFNEEASKFEDVVILTISCDLPFAHDRFCAAFGIKNIMLLSDYQTHDFGLKYKFLIEGLQLLTRGVIVIDKEGVVRYQEYAKEVKTHVDYDKALEAIEKLV